MQRMHRFDIPAACRKRIMNKKHVIGSQSIVSDDTFLKIHSSTLVVNGKTAHKRYSHDILIKLYFCVSNNLNLKDLKASSSDLSLIFTSPLLKPKRPCWPELFCLQMVCTCTRRTRFCSPLFQIWCNFSSDFESGLRLEFAAGRQPFESKAKVVISLWGIIMENPQEPSFSEEKLNVPPLSVFCLNSSCLCPSSAPSSLALGTMKGFKWLCVRLAGCGLKVPVGGLYTQPWNEPGSSFI